MIYRDTRLIYRCYQAEPMLISEADLVGAATAASKPGKPKAASSKSVKKATASLAPDDEPLVTVATEKATGKMVIVPKPRPTRAGASGNAQTPK